MNDMSNADLRIIALQEAVEYVRSQRDTRSFSQEELMKIAEKMYSFLLGVMNK